uniref:G-protein coupled receptors family 1 profile domain-containing protein n=1 Tax=Periophthalmus magnuspinnatus TaxID=409849 RepID=A0A3B3ZSI6_9GOBI
MGPLPVLPHDIARWNSFLMRKDYKIDQRIVTFSITTAILYLIVCVMGLAGNILVITAILKLDKLSSSTTVYIFNLALADGLFMIGLPFIASQNFQNAWMFGDMACKVVMVLDGINQFTSVFCLTMMSVDRYLALLNPLRFASWRTPRFAKIVSSILWFFSLLTILPMALHFTAEQGLCMPELASDAWWLGVLSYTFVIGFALPFTVMTASYTALICTFRSQRLHIVPPACPGSSQGPPPGGTCPERFSVQEKHNQNTQEYVNGLRLWNV